MDRVFLDANVLFSAAYSRDSKLRSLWTLQRARMITSNYAIEEATRNLDSPPQIDRLDRLITRTTIVPEASPDVELPNSVRLPDKDVPILLAALSAGATHLLTGDKLHFGPYMNRQIAGLKILTPGEYLKS